jgi:hypothetical protein
MSISGNLVGSYSQLGKTFTLVDENGAEMLGVIVGQETIFTATDNDVRVGSVYASNEGVSTGTKIIPAYHTMQGVRLVTAGSKLIIPNIIPDVDIYDYTKLQSMICLYNTSLSKSVSTEKVLIDGFIYNVQSVDPISTVTKNHESKTVELGITNDSNNMLVIRYFMYKEIK